MAGAMNSQLVGLAAEAGTMQNVSEQPPVFLRKRCSSNNLGQSAVSPRKPTEVSDQHHIAVKTPLPPSTEELQPVNTKQSSSLHNGVDHMS